MTRSTDPGQSRYLPIYIDLANPEPGQRQAGGAGEDAVGMAVALEDIDRITGHGHAGRSPGPRGPQDGAHVPARADPEEGPLRVVGEIEVPSSVERHSDRALAVSGIAAEARGVGGRLDLHRRALMRNAEDRLARTDNQ